MKASLLLLLVLAVKVWGQPITPGYNATLCGDGDCATSSDGPVCYDGKCVQCNPGTGTAASRNGDCICGFNHFFNNSFSAAFAQSLSRYCVSDPADSAFATCRDYESDIIGTRCDPALQCSSRFSCAVKKDLNDKLFCGKIIFMANGTVDSVEWTGACVGGTCQICSPSSSRCNGQGRACFHGKWVYAPISAGSWAYFAENPAIWNTFWAWAWIYFLFPVLAFISWRCVSK